MKHFMRLFTKYGDRIHLYSETMFAASTTVLPRKLRRMQPHVSRYWMYSRVLDALAPRGKFKHTRYVLLADTRDVVFQTDPFAAARAYVSAQQPEQGTPGVHSTNVTDTVLVAQEPAPWTLGTQEWNKAMLSSVLREHIVDALQSYRVICSGTTLGTQGGIQAYLRVMLQALTFASSGGAAFKKGVDQPVHDYIVHMGRAAAAASPPLSAAEAAWPAPSRFTPQTPSEGAIAVGADASLSRASQQSAHARLLAASLAEPVYTELLQLALQLRESAAVHVVPHEAGLMCTMHLAKPQLVSLAAGGLLAAEDPAAGGWPLTATADSGSGVAADAGTARRACAIVHQYDRHPPLVELYQKLYGKYKKPSA
jgi:hypothetical protein